MSETNKKCSTGKKILLAVLAVIIVIAIFVWVQFGSLIQTVLDVKQVDNQAFFTMEYHGDYGFDKFLKTGASTDTELVQFIVNELTHGIPLEFDLPDLGCSTFSAKNKEGQAIFGRNFDMYDSPAMIVKTAPDNGYKSISMVNLAYIGYNRDHLPDKVSNRILALTAPYVPMDGMNEKGLAVSVMLIDTEPTNQTTDKVDITTTTAIRMLLDKAATVEEAIALMEQYDMHASANSSYHFMVADASGDSAVLEYIGNELSVLRGERVSTNFLLTPGEYDFGGGFERYDIVKNSLDEHEGIVSEEEAMGILEACKQPEDPEKDSATQWSCVYNLDTVTVNVSIKMDYDNIYTYSLKL